MVIFKRYLPFIISILITISSYVQTLAQGWQWGRLATGGTIDSWAIATDTSGNVYGAGITTGSPGPLDFGGGVIVTVPSAPSVFLGSSIWVKYSNSGTPLWAGGTTGGYTYLYNIAVDLTGNLILFGAFSSPTMQIGSFTLTNIYGSTGSSQYYLAKVSPSGVVLWAVSDGNTGGSGEIVFGYDVISSNGGVTTDSAGNIYITSAFNKPSITIGSTTLSNADPFDTSSDIFVAKYNPSGVPLWAKSFGGTLNDYSFGITVSSIGYIYITGAFYSPSIIIGSGTLSNVHGAAPYGVPLAFIAKFSTSGVPLWGQSAGGNRGSFGIGLVNDNYGNVYMTGGFGDTDISFGSTTITKTYPGSLELELYLARFSSSDTVTWSKTIGSASVGLFGYSVVTTPCGQVWVCGKYTADADIDGLTIPVAAGVDPVFIAGYNLAGGVAGYAGLGSGGDDQIDIASDKLGNIFICGDILGIATIYMGPDTLTNYFSEALYLGKYLNAVSPPDTISTVKDTTLLCGDSIMLTGNPGYTHYYWNDGSIGSTLIAFTPGTYFVYNVMCGEPVVVDTFHISIFPLDTLYHNQDTIACATDATVIILTAPAGSNYSWYDGSSAVTDSVRSAGNYWVKYLTGCSYNIDTFNVKVEAPPCNTSTAALIKKQNLELYPNPAQNVLAIISANLLKSITISNLLGQTVYSHEYNTYNIQVDVSTLLPGIYIIKINGSEMRKFAKE